MRSPPGARGGLVPPGQHCSDCELHALIATLSGSKGPLPLAIHTHVLITYVTRKRRACTCTPPCRHSPPGSYVML